MIEWHLILNRTGARIYKSSSRKEPLRLIKTFKNPLGDEPNRNMQADRSGMERFRIPSASIPYSMPPRSEPHEEAAVQFVRTVGRWLAKEEEKKSFEKLFVFADPHLSGLLRPDIEDLKTEIRWYHKNIAKLTDHEVNKAIHEYKRA